MPLDTLTDVVDIDTSLHAAVRRLGINPISIDVLHAHKQAELRKHPGSWWHNHLGLGAFLCLVGILETRHRRA